MCEREIAVPHAIGVSRTRLVSQLLSESMLLAFFRALLGALLASLLSHGLLMFLTTPGNALYVGLGVDWRLLGFTAAIAVATCLLFGLAPALRATRVDPASVMRSFGLDFKVLTAQLNDSLMRDRLIAAFVGPSSIRHLPGSAPLLEDAGGRRAAVARMENGPLNAATRETRVIVRDRFTGRHGTIDTHEPTSDRALAMIAGRRLMIYHK